jgi:predicted 3-demethylubiquinone-9 3-methyltransferase (glyoxalase superfamily)
LHAKGAIVQKIIPHLWYDKEAAEAATLYTSLFPGSRILSRSTMGDTPSGTVEILKIDLAGLEMMMMSAGPYFQFNPAISLLVACDTAEEVDKLHAGLGSGNDLMPLGSYPFSGRYAWTADRFGLSWQIMLMDKIPRGQRITPTLMFTGAQCGKAEEAMRAYSDLIPRSASGPIMRYGAGEEPNKAGTVKHGAFTLDGKAFAAMDSAYEHGFSFNEAVSLMVYCDHQGEIDRFWNALSAQPEAEQCGWLKDRYGLSWQIVPTAMDRMMANGSPEAIARVTKAFLAMKKFDVAALERAYRGV